MSQYFEHIAAYLQQLHGVEPPAGLEQRLASALVSGLDLRKTTFTLEEMQEMRRMLRLRTGSAAAKVGLIAKQIRQLPASHDDLALVL